MNSYGYIRVGCAVPKIKVADCKFNKEQIIHILDKAQKDFVKILVFPELCMTGYTCGDLFHQQTLLDETETQIKEICDLTKTLDMLFFIGAPIMVSGKLYNCALALNQGKILKIVPKTYLPNYNEYYEKRWFASSFNIQDTVTHYAGQEIPFGIHSLLCCSSIPELVIGTEICEDLWVPIPPSAEHALHGATLLVNLSASNDIVGKFEYRRSLVVGQSASCIAGYIYTSAGPGESTTDVVFGGHCIIAENGSIINERRNWDDTRQFISTDLDMDKLTCDRRKNTSYFNSLSSNDIFYKKILFTIQTHSNNFQRTIHPYPFVPNNVLERDDRCEEIFNIQTQGLAKRIEHIGCKKVVVGISGGLDSTLALLVCTKTFDRLGLPRENIIGVTMPGFGTTDRTYQNALQLMKDLKISIREISIRDACLQHFEDIGHSIEIHDITYENTQARERTQVLMDIANQERGIVIGTGDLSELALGWATYNGDHMSMYAVNVSIPKTLVRYLVQWIADHEVKDSARTTLMDVLDTPISPELLPPDEQGKILQKTEDVVGPYELHDFYLYYMLRFGFSPKKIYALALKAFHDSYSEATIYHWLQTFYRRFFSQQFKRSCLPDGPKVGSICLSPRGDWRMPSDASYRIWLDEIEEIKRNPSGLE